MVILILLVLGLALGSFTNALVWRIHEQSKSKKAQKDEKLSILHGRSMCVHCGHQLSAYDLVPVFSWVSLKGKCRYCKKPISWQYPAVELITSLLFVVSYLFWPLNLSSLVQYACFASWLILVVLGVALSVYDLKWMTLPNRLVYPTGAFAATFAVIMYFNAKDTAVLLSSVLGCILFGGFFYSMYQISQGKWIGGGDVRLGFVLGIILGWQKSILGLTLAAYLGTIMVVILLLARKYHRKMKMPFGPFLLTSTFVVVLFGQVAIDWYLRISGLR